MARTQKNQIQYIQKISIGMFLILGAAGGYWWWSGPKAKAETGLVEMAEKKVQLQKVNERTRKAIVSLGSSGIQEQIIVYERQGRFLREMMPPEDTISLLMTQVTNSTRKHGVTIGGFNRIPRREIGGFAAHGFALKFSGRYHEVGAVLAELLGGGRVVHTYKVGIQAVPPGGGKGAAAAKDLRGLNAGPEVGKPWDVEADLEVLELGISNVPTQDELKQRAAAAKAAAEAEALRKSKEKPAEPVKN